MWQCGSRGWRQRLPINAEVGPQKVLKAAFCLPPCLDGPNSPRLQRQRVAHLHTQSSSSSSSMWHQQGINGASASSHLTPFSLFAFFVVCGAARSVIDHQCQKWPHVSSISSSNNSDGDGGSDAGSTKCRHCGNIGNIHTATQPHGAATITMRIPQISINFHDVKRPTNRNKSMPSRPISDCISVSISDCSFDFIHYARQMREESIDKHK